MNSLPKLVCLCGNRGAGKGAIAAYLADFHHYTPRGFAEPLYEQLAVLNPWIQVGESLTNPRFRRYNDLASEFGIDYAKRNFAEVRTYLQRLGTECSRDILGPLTWVNIAEQRSRGDYRTVFSDMRFPNEVAWARTQDCLLIHVTGISETPAGTHFSESAIDAEVESDYTIRNDGTLPDLYELVEATLADWSQTHL